MTAMRRTARAIAHPVLLGLGTAVPAHAMAQHEAATLAVRLCGHTEETAALLPLLYRRTQVATRGSVLLDGSNGDGLRQTFFQPAGPSQDRGPTTRQRMERYAQEAETLALAATRQTLQQAQCDPQRISHLVTVSCTGFAAPGVDIALMKQLRLRRTLERTHVGFMGCHGALNGLRVARAITQQDPRACVLMCAVELCSLHFSYAEDPERMVANALFADGAASVVLGHAKTASRDAWQVAANGACLFPDSEEAMRWQIGDHGFEMTLSARVPGLIRAHVRPWLARWLKTHHLRIDDVRSWAIHPGGPRVLSAVAGALSLRPAITEISRQVLSTCGNMSSATTLFILERLIKQHAPRPCVALAFGPGLAAESALFM